MFVSDCICVQLICIGIFCLIGLRFLGTWEVSSRFVYDFDYQQLQSQHTVAVNATCLRVIVDWGHSMPAENQLLALLRELLSIRYCFDG